MEDNAAKKGEEEKENEAMEAAPMGRTSGRKIKPTRFADGTVADVIKKEPLASDDEDVLPVRVPIIPRRGLVPFKRGRGRPKKVKFGDEFEETEPSAPLVCDFDNNCGFKTSKMSRMREHIASVHVTEVAHECLHCDYRTSTKDRLREHVRFRHKVEARRRRFKCKQCGKKFLTRTRHENHVATVHEGRRPYNCEYCLKTFGSIASLNTHVTSIHEGKRPHECNQCDYKAFSKNILDKHYEAKHTARIRDKQCPLCPHKTFSNALLQTHFRNMHGSKDRFCPMCFKSYATDALLNMHMREVHLKEKPIACEFCDYRAARKSHMSSHMAYKHPPEGVEKKKIGPRVKRFRCSQCEYRAASRVIVAKHFRAKHTEFGKYKCRDCLYITSQKPNLDYHVKSKHETENPVECTMCSYSALLASTLANHVKMVHDKQRHIECMACEYLAPTETHMQWHMRREHGTSDRMDRPKFNQFDDWHPDYDRYDADAEDYEEKYQVKQEPFMKIGSSIIDFNEDLLAQQEIEAGMTMEEAGELTDDEYTPAGVRRTGRKRRPTAAAMEAIHALKAAYNRKQQIQQQQEDEEEEEERLQQQEQEAAQNIRRVIVGDNPDDVQHMQEISTVQVPVVEGLMSADGTMVSTGPEQISTYVVTDATGNIVATEGVTMMDTEDPDQMQFELTTVDDSGNPITFQVATMQGSAGDQQVITLETPGVVTADVPDDEGAREGVTNSFQCNECFKVFKNQRQLSAHEAAVHLKEKPYSCEVCPYRASRKQHIKSHMETHRRRQEQGPKGEHECERCDFAHDDKFYLECHVKLQHEGAQVLVCDLCEFSSTTTYRLVKHVDSVHKKVKNFFCEQCDYCCAEKGSLKIHVQIKHDKKKVHKCMECDFSAFVSSHLTYHMRSKHENRADYECDECDKAFIDMRALRAHKSAVHLKEKPYKCSICDYRANRKQHIKVHMKKHINTYMGVKGEEDEADGEEEEHEEEDDDEEDDDEDEVGGDEEPSSEIGEPSSEIGADVEEPSSDVGTEVELKMETEADAENAMEMAMKDAGQLEESEAESTTSSTKSPVKRSQRAKRKK